MMNNVCPLVLLAAGTEAAIAEIRGGRGLRARLSGMGLCSAARVTIRSTNCGSVIVAVGDARYALSRGIATKILVREVQETA